MNVDSLKDRYVTGAAAARILGMHPRAIQRLILQGRLPGEKVANLWLIPRDVVEEFAKTYTPKRGRPKTKR